jgi:branched-chain amino acid transport system permease protein
VTVPLLEKDTASARVRVRRSDRTTVPTVGVGICGVVVLAFAPYVFSQADTSLLVNFFILLTVSVMWNLLAGYAGLVSIGQQTFIGLGAYGIVVFADNGMNPFAAIPVAAIICGAIALPVSLVAFRLRGGYFAIATWVIADTAELVISSISGLGGGTGHPVAGLSSLSPKAFGEATYWAALAVALLAIGAAYLLLRSRLGLVLEAVRDDEVGARSAGALVTRARRIVFVVAGIGCGAAGALLAVSQLQVQPNSVFSVQWAAEMIFVTMIGGMGTIEGPILGTVIFFVLQQNLANDGAWYLIIFGSLAVLIAIWAPGGVWGLITRRFKVEPFPVGFNVVFADDGASRGPDADGPSAGGSPAS